MAIGGRKAQYVVRISVLYVLIGVADREVLSDDLLGLVALDALGSRVPGGDTPLCVEHEDRVVVDAFNQQTKAFLVIAERLLSPLALCNVPDDGEHVALLLRTYSVSRFDRAKAHLDPDLCAIF